jgi:uncharacterized membrane protein
LLPTGCRLLHMSEPEQPQSHEKREQEQPQTHYEGAHE